MKIRSHPLPNGIYKQDESIMIALIDGDLVAYRCAASCSETDPLEVAIMRCDKLVLEILDSVKATHHNIYISTQSNFRKEINPEYKANRKDQVPPQWLQECKEFLVTEWKARTREFYEADDLLGIDQINNPARTVICSLDKDLKMIPGDHFSWEISTTKWTKPASYITITPDEGIRTFYTQMLVGDTTDNIIGVAGLGPVKSAKYLSSAENEQELFDLVYDKYNDPERFLMNGMCLWICQNEEETWVHHLKKKGLIIPNQLEPVLDQMYESMKFITTTT